MVEITNTESPPNGYEIDEKLGIARGNSVRARNVGRDITQSIRNLIGGDLKAYSNLFSDTREEALKRLREDAEYLGADAVVNVRFDSSAISQNSAEVLAYGTAVKLKEKE